jgi:hypothetical protein
MNGPEDLLNAGIPGGVLAVLAWFGGRWRGKSLRASVVVSDDATAANTSAVEQQTAAIDRQTKEARRVAERLGSVGGQLLGLTGAVADLRTEVHGLREDMSAMDRRVVRLEARHETNGSPAHGH